MSGSERAGLFEDEDAGEIDVSGFAPKPKPSTPPVPPEQVRAVSQARGFRSREPQPVAAAAPASAPAPVAEAPRREPRRYRTGRNVQLNIKARSEVIDSFYAIADRQGWVLGQAFEEAVAALERSLTGKK
jgi:hypothetical protein